MNKLKENISMTGLKCKILSRTRDLAEDEVSYIWKSTSICFCIKLTRYRQECRFSKEILASEREAWIYQSQHIVLIQIEDNVEKNKKEKCLCEDIFPLLIKGQTPSLKSLAVSKNRIWTVGYKERSNQCIRILSFAF